MKLFELEWPFTPDFATEQYDAARNTTFVAVCDSAGARVGWFDRDCAALLCDALNAAFAMGWSATASPLFVDTLATLQRGGTLHADRAEHLGQSLIDGIRALMGKPS